MIDLFGIAYFFFEVTKDARMGMRRCLRRRDDAQRRSDARWQEIAPKMHASELEFKDRWG